MPQPEELFRLLHRKPFEPFRVHLTDGRVFDIRFPEINVVGWNFLVIGIPVANDPDPVAERTIEVLLAKIANIEPISPSPAVNS